MIIVLDVVGTYECVECDDPARPRDSRCTSCRAWRDEGEFPTTLASVRAALDDLGHASVCDPGDEVAARLLREMSDRLLTLEARRDRVHRP